MWKMRFQGVGNNLFCGDRKKERKRKHKCSISNHNVAPVREELSSLCLHMHISASAIPSSFFQISRAKRLLILEIHSYLFFPGCPVCIF